MWPTACAAALPWRSLWPPDERPLSRADRIALQRALGALGYKVGNTVGHIDFEQRDIIRELQTASAWCRTATRTRCARECQAQG